MAKQRVKKNTKTYHWIPVALLLPLVLLEIVLPYAPLSGRLALATTSVATMLLLWHVVERFRDPEPVLAISFAALLGLGVDAVGNFFHWYTAYIWYDALAHATGSAAVTFIVGMLLLHALHTGPYKFGHTFFFFFVLGISAIFGVCYELSEYIGDIAFHLQRIGNSYDTVDDLLWNTVGTLLVMALFFLHPKIDKQLR